MDLFSTGSPGLARDSELALTLTGRLREVLGPVLADLVAGLIAVAVPLAPADRASPLPLPKLRSPCCSRASG